MVYHLHSTVYDFIFAIRLLKSFCLCHFVSEKYFNQLLLLSTGAIMTLNHGTFVKVSTFFFFSFFLRGFAAVIRKQI